MSLLTLALAIGANTAVFSVTRAVLVKPLPYGVPSSLVALFEGSPRNPAAGLPLSPPNFVDYRAQQRTFTGIAAYVGLGAVTCRLAGADPEMLSGVAVSPALFGVLQVRALHGRTFAPDDDTPGNDLKAIVSYSLWQRALGGDIAAIDRRISLNGRPYDVIGVMPRGFTLGLGEDVWMPLDLRDDLAQPVRSRKQHFLHAIGRLKPGATVDAARTDLTSIARRLEAQYPEANTGRSAIVVPLHESMTGNLRPALLLLQGAAAMVLLIACANLANLTLSRTIGRRREIALRAAIGAGRGRLVRQLLTESVLLAVVGGTFGVAIAVLATRTLLALNPDTLPEMFVADVDLRVLLSSIALSVATGVLFGLVPALDAARADLNDSLKAGGRGMSEGRGGERLRRMLVVAQVGLTVMLLIGAGLLMRSFRELTRVRLGFEPDRVLTAELRAAGARYDSSAMMNRFYDGVIGAVARSPGIIAVGAASSLPTRGRVYSSLRVEGEPVDERNLPDVGYIAIRGEYFKAMRIPLVAGREYDASDTPNGPKTVILNETAARRFFPNGDAVGRRIRIGPDPRSPAMVVIGVVGDIRDEGFGVAAKPTLFANHRQETWLRTLAVVIRTSGDPEAAAPVLRSALKATDPTLAVREIKSLNDVLGTSLAPRRFALGLASYFGAVAVLLAAVGIYGVLAYTVTTRTREFGVRLALGGTARNLLILVARQGLGWSLLGLTLGIGGAVVAGRLLGGMLYGVSPVDISTYSSVAIGLLVVVCVACIGPASRAARVDPLTSLRAE